jgi:hypothetical protein
VKEQGLQVDLDHIIPVRLTELKRGSPPDDARVVDQDIQPTHLFGHLRHRLVQLLNGGVTQVAAHSQEAPAQRLDLGLRLLKRDHIQAGDVRASLCQADGHGLPQTPASTSDQGHLAVQLKRI